MGNIQVSRVNAMIAGETIGNCYDIYKILNLDKNDYFKVDDLSDFDIKFVFWFYKNLSLKPSNYHIKI